VPSEVRAEGLPFCASVQGDPIFTRRVNGWLVIF
jgi:hypothetical protein